MKQLEGYKSYIGAILLFIVGGLMGLGIIDQQQFEALAAIIGSLAIYGIRSAIKKIE